MKKVYQIVCASILALSCVACAEEKFSTELTNDDKGFILTAENASKGTSVGAGMDVLEGEHVIVTGNVTSGAVQFRMVKDGSDKPSVDWTFTGTNEEIEYDVDPGSYMVGFTSSENKTTGNVSVITKEHVASNEADGQNPIMNFIGVYAMDRCSIEVSAADDKDGAKFIVQWGSSAAEHSEWHMSGTFDTNTLTVHYDNCEKKDVVFKEDGSVESETVVYQNGKGSFTFNNEKASLTWNDEEEHAADDMVFEWALGN